jgi:FkbM family methyltransferase
MDQSISAVWKYFVPPFFSARGGSKPKSCKQRRASATPEDERQQFLKAEHEARNTYVAEDEIVLRDHIRLKIHPECRHGFDYFCYKSPAMVDELNAFLAHARDKYRLLDVGALHGLFSLVFAANRQDKTAVAVDASPIAFARLLYNIHKNRLGNITPVECALSAGSGTLRMHYEWEHAVAAPIKDSSQKGICVNKRSGDELCEELAFLPDIVKIDVEGHEVKVIQGLSRVIGRSRPVIFLELHPARIAQEQDRIDDLVRFFESSGYRSALVDGSYIAIDQLSGLANDQRLILSPN